MRLIFTGLITKKKPHKFIKQGNWIKADLTKPDSCKPDLFRGYDVVIMCAAVSSGAKNIIQRPEIFVGDNTLINQNTITKCVEEEVAHVIFPSCSIMYKSSDKIQTEDDVDLNNIARQYLGGAAMKLYAEGLCKFYSTRSKTKFSVLRHTLIVLALMINLTLGSHMSLRQ